MSYDIAGISASERTVWASEYKKDFSVDQVLLPQLTDRRGVENAGVVTFTIPQDDGTARGRGRTGEIPYRRGTQGVVSATLKEAVDGMEIPNFAAFKSAVDQRQIMYMQVNNTIKRAMNDEVVSILDTTSNEWSGTAAAGASATLMSVIAKVRNRTKGYDGEMFWLCSEHMFLQVENNPKVSSKDYVDNLRMPDGRRPLRWRGITFVPYPELPGAGTSSCKTFLFAKTAVHYHASEQPFIADFDNRHRKYFCNAQVMHCGVLALSKGVERFLHDDTAAFAA